MARKPRLEVDGGLYHLITRGVDRRDIFHSPEDHKKFLSLLALQKEKLPFFLYAYCLMTNHVHLLIERMTDDVGRIMHRVLTGYTQYYNRKYRRSGHLLQGRHKSILCQSDMYLAELVRYIHLNPIRAKMVRKVENYPFTSHRAYMGLEEAGIVDVDPVLRRFAARKSVARERYAKHMAAGMKMGHLAELYETRSGVLGSEEFIDAAIHQMGDVKPRGTRRASVKAFDGEALLRAVEAVTGIQREEFSSRAKGALIVRAREALVLSGRRLGASATDLAWLTGLDVACISRRHDAAIRRAQDDRSFQRVITTVIENYKE